MKTVVFGFTSAFLSAFLAISFGHTQNISINLEPINSPIQISAPGGSFDYNITLRNTGTIQQTFSAWIMLRLPDQSWYGPVVGPTTLTLPGLAGVLRQRSQAIPANAPEGNYVYEGRVGIYPNMIWNADSFSFAKTTEGSQEWVARYNGPAGFLYNKSASVGVDGIGNVYVTGFSACVPECDFTTIKYNSIGEQQWVMRYSGPGNSFNRAVSLAIDDSAGYIYVTGFTSSNGSGEDYVTIKYSSSGEQIWVQIYNGPGNGDDKPCEVVLDRSGNVYVTGYSLGQGSSWDFATIKYNASGATQWIARYDGPDNSTDQPLDLKVDTMGNVYVAGSGVTSPLGYDFITVKYGSLGQELWNAIYDGPTGWDDGASALDVDGEGNVYVTGITQGPEDQTVHFATVKYNALGQQLWVRIYDGPGRMSDAPSALTLDRDANVYVTGGGSTPPLGTDFTTIKYNTAGNLVWVSCYNGTGNGFDEAYAVAVDPTRNVFVTGKSEASPLYPFNNDYATVKYDSTGRQQWVMRYKGPGSGDDVPSSLALDLMGNVYVTGYCAEMGTGTDYCTVKYSGANVTDWMPAEALIFGLQEPVTEYSLYPNHPNPFNATTAISYELRGSSLVNLSINDISGRWVTTLVNGWRDAGSHELTFDGSDLPSGIYFARLTAGEYTAVQKLVLLK